MGLSNLTRYLLFKEAADFLRTGNNFNFFENTSFVSLIYWYSAELIKGFEENIESYETEDDFWKRFEENSRELPLEYVGNIRGRILNDRTYRQEPRSGKGLFRLLVKAIGEYQEENINQNTFSASNNYTTIRTRGPQTFLSYAYDDKGLSFALFIYFWIRNGFLYVDWMWEKNNKSGAEIKNNLEQALRDSFQLLLLRTVNSELRIRGNHNIRQWCSWEIGNFYTKHRENKFYTSFYDSKIPDNIFLKTFRPMKNINKGMIE